MCIDSVIRSTDSIQELSSGAVPTSMLQFKSNIYRDVKSLVVVYHYSKRMSSNVQYTGGFYLDGKIIAGIAFSIPPTRWKETVWELSRLVRIDDIRLPLTKLISLALHEVKIHIDLVVSFADNTQNHIGYVYQAASWYYGGFRAPCMDGVIVDDVFIPGRSANSKWGTRSPTKLSLLLSKSVAPHWDKGKYLYWKPLSKTGTEKAKRLGLLMLPYVKEEINEWR